MTVSELITALEEFDGDLEVAVGFPREERDIETVELVDETRRGRITGAQVRCNWVALRP